MITHLLQPLFPIDPTLSMARVSYMCHSDVFLKEIYFESKDSHLKKNRIMHYVKMKIRTTLTTTLSNHQ